MKILDSFFNDIALSNNDVQKLNLSGYNRISSSLTGFYKYFISSILMFIIIFNSKDIISKFSLNYIFVFIIILFALIWLIIKCIILKNVFISTDMQKIIVCFPYRRKMHVLTENELIEVNGSTFIKNDFITLRYKIDNRIWKISFLAKYRLMKIFDEHPIVKEINKICKANE